MAHPGGDRSETDEAGGCRLHLVVETAPGDSLADRLMPALMGSPVPSLELRPAKGAKLAARDVASVVEAIQASGTAVLIADDPALARALRADGVHLSAGDTILERYAEARDILGTRFIVGADAGRSRHDAMTVGEAGADYIAFGIPDFVGDRETAAARRADLVAWWAEIFEVPVVAHDAEDLLAAADLAAAGADFVALRLPAGLSAADTAAWIADAARTLAAASDELDVEPDAHGEPDEETRP